LATTISPSTNSSPWPVRLLVVADLGGDVAAPRPATGATLDDLMASMRPRLGPGPGVSREILFRSLADFSPEALRLALPAAVSPDESWKAVDALLHAPRFQAIEAAWRGLDRLLRQAGDGRDVEIDVLDLATPALRASPDRIFGGPERACAAVLVDSDIGGALADGAFLREVAALAERRRTAVLLGAAPSLLGLRHAAHLPGLSDPADRLDAAWGGGWRAFRASDAARWVGLTINRFLLRPVYTQEAGAHAETASPGRPDDYLWGRGVWLAGADLVRSRRDRGDPLTLSGIVPERLHLELPVWTWSSPGGARRSSSLEAALDLEAVQPLVRSGLSPLFESAGAGSAVLPLIVNAYRTDPRKIPVEGTLAHTLVLGRFVSALAATVPAVEAEPDDAAADLLLRGALQKALASRLTDGVSATLRTAVERPQGRRVARAFLRGDLTGSGRDAEIELSIPLTEGAA